METKRTCLKCKKEFDLIKDNFYASKNNPNGLEATCKFCRRDYAKTWKARAVRAPKKVDETKCSICSANGDTILGQHFTADWKFAGMTCKSCATILLLCNESSDLLLNAFLFLKNSEKK